MNKIFPIKWYFDSETKLLIYPSMWVANGQVLNWNLVFCQSFPRPLALARPSPALPPSWRHRERERERERFCRWTSCVSGRMRLLEWRPNTYWLPLCSYLRRIPPGYAAAVVSSRSTSTETKENKVSCNQNNNNSNKIRTGSSRVSMCIPRRGGARSAFHCNSPWSWSIARLVRSRSWRRCCCCWWLWWLWCLSFMPNSN